ncbi:MAG TPA: nuclear transport factor 2 family protein [Terracidiphilus sp.]|nr:nuclear transport factor 2 family protein [Terracidiphilus sp.]
MSTRSHMRAQYGNRFRAAGLLVVLLFAAVSIPAMPHNERHEVRHEIDHLEDRWRQAALSANVAAMDGLLADDYIGITSNGSMQSKDDTLAYLRAGTMHFTSIELSDRKVRFYGSTALVTSKAEIAGTGPGGDISGSYRYTHVYARNPHGIWQIVSFEASRIREHDSEDHK